MNVIIADEKSITFTIDSYKKWKLGAKEQKIKKI